MGDFERKWSEAFEGAEATPSNELWTGIHAKLANTEAATYKKHIVYYRWAAAVALLLLVGVSTYTFIKTDKQNIADQTTVHQDSNQQSSSPISEETLSQDEKFQNIENDQIADQSTASDDRNDSDISSDHSSNVPEQNSDLTTDKRIALEDGNGAISDQTAKGIEANSDNTDQNSQFLPDTKSNVAAPVVLPGIQDDEKTIAGVHSGSDIPEVSLPTGVALDNNKSADPTLNDQKSLVATEEVSTPDQGLFGDNGEQMANASESTWVAINGMGAEVAAVETDPHLEHIYLVPVIHVNQPIQKEKASKLWAGLSFGPGSFDPNYHQQTAETQLVAAAAPNARSSFIVKEDSNPGSSVALGMDVGMNLGTRWRVASGLQYFNSSVDANTNAVAEASNTPVYNSFSSYDLSANRGVNSGRYIFAPDTDLQSTFEFLSVPLEAGYVVLDRKVQVVLNAGVGTNIFIKNNIQDKQNNLADVTITPGASAPFKTVYFNGLMGAEILYGIGDQFNISLKPQYRTALNDFTKSNSEFSSRPNAFGVSLGLQYNIK